MSQKVITTEKQIGESQDSNPKKHRVSFVVIAILFILILLVGAYLAYLKYAGPAENHSSVAQQTSAPQSVIDSANDMIIALVGKDFFSKYISLVSSPDRAYECGYQCEGSTLGQFYTFTYALKIPEKSIDTTIWFYVDKDGKLPPDNPIHDSGFPSGNVIALPNCVDNAKLCEFISKDDAIQAVKQAGLDAGISDWQVTFSKATPYSWEIKAKLLNESDVSKDPEICKLQNLYRYMYVDANTGKVLGDTKIHAYCNSNASTNTTSDSSAPSVQVNPDGSTVSQ